MSEQKLIIITGSPCIGKTAVAERLFESYENSAFFDGDEIKALLAGDSMNAPNSPSAHSSMKYD